MRAAAATVVIVSGLGHVSAAVLASMEGVTRPGDKAARPLLDARVADVPAV
jgi:hypothetical protein